MERRIVLAVVLMVAVIFLSNILFPPTPIPPPETEGVVETPDSSAVARGAEPEAEEEAPPVEAPRAEIEEQRPPPLAAAEPADTLHVASDLYDLRFSTDGAGLIRADLSKYVSFARNGSGKKPVQLVRPGDRLFVYQLAVGGDTVSMDGRPFVPNRKEVRLSADVPVDSLVFRYTFPGSEVSLILTYRFRNDRYVVEVNGRLEGFPDRGYSVLVPLGRGLETNEKDPREDYRDMAYVVNGRRGGIRSIGLDRVAPSEVRTADGGPFHWVALKSKYFLVAALAPREGPLFGGVIASGVAEEHAARVVASLPVPAGRPGFTFDIYVGPQEYGRLEAASQNLEDVSPYGWRWMRPIIRPLVGIVVIVLTWLHRTLSLAYGWVLILFGVLMRVVLFPLYQKSMRAQMAQMQVQPLMKELQAKHKNDPQKLQQEMVKLYKEHNVNPVAGCLPMMLPMPVLFALFFVFRSTIEFRGVPFLWLPDLSLKDPLYIIPLVMGLSMFVLTWIGQRGMEANAQMRMMGWLMPVVFTVLFLQFPSGLNLYYATSNIASLPQQLYLSRERRAARERAGVLEAKRRSGGADSTQRGRRRS